MTLDDLDRCIFEAVSTGQIKTVRIIHEVHQRTKLEFEEIAERIYYLSNTGALEGFGDLEQWRHSELRLPLGDKKPD